MLTRGWAQLTQVSQMRVDRPVRTLRSKALLQWKASLSWSRLAL